MTMTQLRTEAEEQEDPRLKVLYIGNFEPDHSTENHYAASFEAIGCEVQRAQEPNRPELADSFLDVVREGCRAYEPDLVLYTRTWGLPLKPWTEFWRELESGGGAQTAAVHLDRWMGLDREHEVEEQPMFTMGTVFTADGDAQAMYEAHDVNHYWLPPGVFKPECYDAEPHPLWQGNYDVAFVGSAPTSTGGNYHHEWPHRGQLVSELRSRFGDRFVHVGNGGQIGTLRGHMLNRFYSSVPVIVGDSCCITPESLYWSDRIPETWGRGGFLLHPHQAAHFARFGREFPGWELAAPDEDQGEEWEAMEMTIRGALLDAPGREEVRLDAAQEIRAHHTYENRAAEILLTLGIA